MLFGKNFRISGEKMSSYLRNCLCKSVRPAFYVNKRGVSVHFDEKPLFSKVFVIFQNLSDSKQHFSSFCPLNFSAGLSKLYSGVQRNISWRKPIWNNLFFSNLFFRILNKKYTDFSQKHFGRFRENRSTCPEEQSMKKYETKKRAN